MTMVKEDEEEGRFERRVVIESGDAVSVGVDNDCGGRQRRRQPVDVGVVTVDDAAVIETATLQWTGDGPP